MRRHLTYWLRKAILLTFFYLLLVGKLPPAEIVAGLLCGIAAGAAITATKSEGHLDFRPRVRYILPLLKLPKSVLRDNGLLGAALWRQVVLRQEIAGAFRAVPFDCGGDDGESAARRALVVAAASLTPNTCAVAVDKRSKRMLVHQLVWTPEPPGNGDREWPI